MGRIRGTPKPELQKIPSLQIQTGQQRVQVDHLATALERRYADCATSRRTMRPRMLAMASRDSSVS